MKIAPPLIAFLAKEYPDKGLAPGVTLPRTEVTQLMTTYIKKNNLQLVRYPVPRMNLALPLQHWMINKI